MADEPHYDDEGNLVTQWYDMDQVLAELKLQERLGKNQLEVIYTDSQLRVAEAAELAARLELHQDKVQAEVKEMTAEQRKAKADAILKDLGF